MNYGGDKDDDKVKELHALHTGTWKGEGPELPDQFSFVCEAPTLCRPQATTQAKMGFYDLHVSSFSL